MSTTRFQAWRVALITAFRAVQHRLVLEVVFELLELLFAHLVRAPAHGLGEPDDAGEFASLAHRQQGFEGRPLRAEPGARPRGGKVRCETAEGTPHEALEIGEGLAAQTGHGRRNLGELTKHDLAVGRDVRQAVAQDADRAVHRPQRRALPGGGDVAGRDRAGHVSQSANHRYVHQLPRSRVVMSISDHCDPSEIIAQNLVTLQQIVPCV